MKNYSEGNLKNPTATLASKTEYDEVLLHCFRECKHNKNGICEHKDSVDFDVVDGDLVCKKFEQVEKSDYGKAKLTLVPRKIIYAIAKIREYGVKKYNDPDNWKKVEKERYRDALFRHFMSYLDDPQGVDEESGLPHLWHLACNVAFLCEMENYNKEER